MRYGTREPRTRRVTALGEHTAELLRELVVALVVRRHRHDGAGAVLHQDVVGDVHGDLAAVHGVRDGAAGEDAVLALLLPLDGAARRGLAGG
mgnify:CR=1 FL=1